MRLGLAAAALAAFTLATPAAAQSSAVDVMRGAMERLSANTEGVRDYTLTLRSGVMQTDVYVYRDGDEWEVAAPDEDENPLGGMLKGLVVWPSFNDLDVEFPAADQVSAEEMEEFSRIFTLGSETVNGRPAHALFVRMDQLVDEMDEESGVPDSVQLFLDPQSHQILRLAVVGVAADMAEMGMGDGTMEVKMDFGDYRETEGLTIPHSLRMAMDMDLQLTAEQRAGMAAGMEYARSQMAGEQGPEAQQAAAMIELFVGLVTTGHLEIPVTVERVRVNAGPPAWFQD
jgi:hypothetical protein